MWKFRLKELQSKISSLETLRTLIYHYKTRAMEDVISESKYILSGNTKNRDISVNNLCMEDVICAIKYFPTGNTKNLDIHYITRAWKMLLVQILVFA